MDRCWQVQSSEVQTKRSYSRLSFKPSSKYNDYLMVMFYQMYYSEKSVITWCPTGSAALRRIAGYAAGARRLWTVEVCLEVVRHSSIFVPMVELARVRTSTHYPRNFSNFQIIYTFTWCENICPLVVRTWIVVYMKQCYVRYTVDCSYRYFLFISIHPSTKYII